MTSVLHPYETKVPNSDIKLYEGSLLLRRNGAETPCSGTITLQWKPSLDVVADIEYSSSHLDLNPSNATLSLEGQSAGCGVLIMSTDLDSDGHTRARCLINGGLEMGDAGHLRSVVYHLVNFGRFLDIQTAPASGNRVLGQMTWEAQGWHIVIDSVPHLNDLIKALGTTGGFAITHTARVRRADGSEFTSSHAREVGEILWCFLSFVQGRQVSAILPLGYDANETAVWRMLAPWGPDPWQSVLSWADLHHAGSLASAFLGFMRLREKGGWNDSLRLAIRWYIIANLNAATLQTGIMLTQMALELLAWEFLVQDRQMLVAEAFKKLSAAHRIRLLLVQLGIPVGIPAQMSEMKQTAKQLNCDDAAHVLVKVRNRIVHPEDSQRESVLGSSAHSLLVETWKCGLWMLEVLLLRLFDYEGPYQDRRKEGKWVGDVDYVPWRKA